MSSNGPNICDISMSTTGLRLGRLAAGRDYRPGRVAGEEKENNLQVINK